MRGDVTVYSPKNVLCTMGIHIASGFKRLVNWLLDRLPVTRWIELLTQPED